MSRFARFRALVTRHLPTPLGGLGLLALVPALALTAGPLGGLAGLAIALVGLFVPAVVAFGLGQAALLALIPEPTLLQLVLVEGALFVVLLGPAGRDWISLFGVLPPAILLVAAFGAAAWYGPQQVGLTGTAAGLVLTMAFLSYALHRYERVSLGLAGGEPEP